MTFIKKIVCPECRGTGGANVSSCCGAEPRGTGDADLSDIGICPDCGDYCEYNFEKCPTCKGVGEVFYDVQTDKLNEEEAKFEAERDDKFCN